MFAGRLPGWLAGTWMMGMAFHRKPVDGCLRGSREPQAIHWIQMGGCPHRALAHLSPAALNDLIDHLALREHIRRSASPPAPMSLSRQMAVA